MEDNKEIIESIKNKKISLHLVCDIDLKNVNMVMSETLIEMMESYTEKQMEFEFETPKIKGVIIIQADKKE